ncbi:cytosolic endo-beta-N-acetylglucosaminidase-like [Actinia tenebrosa]|uniref:Cytosolic endo-beta-N-acetylglucosaminidase n=1 Tax=Actinia tenebrosa TaxID=6105 RepID=A0A6P8HT99_ACTTE|nr:cytosolic endo-beta-N-acetylglucosaminidase-like [Actinia tenebrosa]
MEELLKLFIVIWTFLMGIIIILYIWKRHKQLTAQGNNQRDISPRLGLHEARLKHFTNIQETTRKVDKEPNIQEPEPEGEENKCRKRKTNKKTQDKSVTVEKKIINGPDAEIFVEDTMKSTHFDPDTGCPITQPIKTLDEAMRWMQGFDEFNVARFLLPAGYKGLENRPRTLVCHDMRGGYIEDRFVQGYPSCDCYRIYHWQYIDIFVYFSHHFITIPPPTWTNAAHTNGVLVLGTLITEWDDGAQRCSEFLEDEHSYKALAKQLVEIADYYKFDGWLINIENPIQPAKVINLIDFVDYLTKAVHQRNPFGQVIWYDSVTYKGDLQWQNELNSMNGQFFESCDGIFLNYTWSVHQVSTLGHAAAAYQRPLADVYVGVDVFGRGCYAGGGFKTKEAVKIARQEKLSTAIFAPGWVLETQGKQNFTVNQNRFWALLSKECPTHPMAKGIPFVTSLCQGYGEKLFINGKEVLSHPWTNLSCQQIQPTYINAFYNLGGKGGIIISDVSYSLDDAYNGGGCQLVHGRTCETPEKAKGVVRLFETDMTLSSGILVSFTYKLVPKDCFQVGLQFHTDRTPTYILLCPSPSDAKDFKKQDEEESKLSKMFNQKYGVHTSKVLSSSAFTSPIGKEHFEAYAPVTASDHDVVQRIFGVEKSADGWCTRYYLIAGRHLVGCQVKEIRVVCAKPSNNQTLPGLISTPFKLHIGEIKILDPQILRTLIPVVSNLRHRDVIWKTGSHGNTLSLTLMWDCPIQAEMESILYCDVYTVIGDSESNVFIGRSFVDSYRVCNLNVPKQCNSVEFIVQSLTMSKRSKTLENNSSILVTWAK